MSRCDHFIVLCDCGRVVTQCPCQEPEILKTEYPGKCPACDPRPFRERAGEKWEEGASPGELFAWQLSKGIAPKTRYRQRRGRC